MSIKMYNKQVYHNPQQVGKKGEIIIFSTQ